MGDIMKNKILSYTEERPFYANLIIMIFCYIGMFIIPTVVAAYFHLYIENLHICSIISDVVYILLLYFLYLKDLNREAKIYFGDFKKKFKHSFKIYLLGFMGMVFFNLFITIFLKGISSNESQVREMLYSNVVTTMISISIIAPLLEELIFRKTLSPLFKNKWLYSLTCGLLFGFAHIMTNFMQNIFVMSDLLYILPYGALGFSFGLMDYDNKTVFSSIVMHALHNSLTGILLLITYFGGK